MDLIIPNPELSVEEGAVKSFGMKTDRRLEFKDLMAFCRRKGIPTHVPFKRLKPSQKQAIVTIGRDVLVTASAGTGKTAVLSHRAVRRIADAEAGVKADAEG